MDRFFIGATLLLLLCHNQTALAERGTGRDKLLYTATEQTEDPKRGDWRRE